MNGGRFLGPKVPSKKDTALQLGNLSCLLVSPIVAERFVLQLFRRFVELLREFRHRFNRVCVC